MGNLSSAVSFAYAMPKKWIEFKFVPVFSQVSTDWSRFALRISTYCSFLSSVSQSLLMEHMPAPVHDAATTMLYFEDGILKVMMSPGFGHGHNVLVWSHNIRVAFSHVCEISSVVFLYLCFFYNGFVMDVALWRSC